MMKHLKQARQPRPGRGKEPHRGRGRVDSRPVKPPAGATERVPPATPGAGVKGDRPPERAAQRDGDHTKPVFEPGPRPPSGTGRPSEPGDQQPAARRGGIRPDAGGAAEQYVRLRIRVRGDQLSVVDSHLVDGPLSQTTVFPGPNAYEVTSGERLLHAGVLPDLGVQRSFVNPGGPDLQRGHHITERDVFEFSARVPAHEVTAETIGDIRVVLHRVKEEARTPRLGTAPLGRQFERQMRPVAQVVGLPESTLPAAIVARGGRTPTV
jgi:hypothetical protein